MSLSEVSLVIKKCGECPYVDHSGAFTPGGAQSICGHKNAVETFAAHVNDNAPNPDNLAGGDRYHWKHRVVSWDDAPPERCPLRETNPKSEV